MLSSDDDVRDDDETILNDMSGDAELDSDGDKPGDSLTTSKTSNPRKAFMDQFATEGEIPETAETESDEDSEDDQQDDVSADAKTPNDDADESTSDDDEEKPQEDDDDDDIDIGVDLDGIEGVEDDEPVDDDFDPRQDLNKKVWKSTPKEAQQLITRFRRNFKHQQKQIEREKPFAEWTRGLLSDAATVGMETEDLMAYIDLGLRAHQGRPEAIEALGSRMVQHGFKPGHEAPDLSSVQDFLKQQVDTLELDRGVASKVMELINQSVGASAPRRAQQAPPKQEIRQRTSPDSTRAELEEAALGKLQEMDKRFEKRFGESWPALRKRVHREVTLEMSENPRSPTQWVKLWKEKAEQEAKAHVKRSRAKQKQGRSRLRSNSDSLERGASVASKESSSEMSGRQSFHKRYSR